MDSPPILTITQKTKPRRLTGLYTVGTIGVGMTCYTFSGPTNQADVSSDYCRFDANNICRGCFVATESNLDKVLEVVQCSAARFKVGESIEEQIIMEITVVNADTDNLLTVKGCGDTSCAHPLSSYTLDAGVAATGYCYTNGTDRLYFPPEAFQHAQSYDFGGKTITGGTFNAVDIDGGSINDTDISLTSVKTLDVSKGTLGLADGQIPANKVGQGTFSAGTYSFASSTVSDLGTVDNVDVRGGNISGTTINSSDISVSAGNTLDVSAGSLNLAESQVPAKSVGPGYFGPGVYSFEFATIDYTGIINWATINGGGLNSVNIGLSTPGYAKFLIVAATEKVATSTAFVHAGDPIANTQCGTVFSLATPLLNAGSVQSITVITNKVRYDPVVATAYPCSGGGEPVVLDVMPLDGSFTVRVKNIGTSDCTGPYGVHFLVLGPE